MRVLLCLLTFSAAPVAAEIMVPNRTIRPGEIIASHDLIEKEGNVAGAAVAVQDLAGLEARVALYPGRPVPLAHVGPPAIVDRNQLVMLVYRSDGLHIVAEGRALGRGARGDFIRVMNLASRSTVTGRVAANGTIEMN